MIFGLHVMDFWDPRSYAAVADLGVKWVRVDFTREFIEPAPGQYNWDDYDRFLAAMQPLGVQVLGEITHTPPWISWTDWERQYADVETFCREVVRRYKPDRRDGYGITHWEIFNEPNLPGYGWLGPRMDAIDHVPNYAKCLQIAYDTIKQEDPGATILLGGLSSDPSVEPWSAEFYGLPDSPIPHYDIFAFHPYGYAGNFTEIARSLRANMALRGEGSKQLWFNEFGSATESEQAIFLQQAWNERDAADATFWYCLADGPQGTYGLVTADYRPKPAYVMFKSFMSPPQDAPDASEPAA